MSFDESQVNRAATGRFSEKTGSSPEVELDASAHSAVYGDLQDKFAVYEAYRNMKEASERSGSMEWFERTFSGGAATRYIELDDGSDVDLSTRIVCSMPRGSRTPTHRGGSKETWERPGSQRAVSFYRGEPVDEFDSDTTITVDGTRGGTLTVKPGVHALIAVNKRSAVRIVFEPGASGKVISASEELKLVAGEEVEVHGSGTRTAYTGA